MKRILALSLSAAFACGAAQAAEITFDSASVGSGLTKYTFTLSQTSGDPGLLGGLDLTFTASTMNQVNPFTLSTIFQDNNATFAAVPETVDEDSQFLFASGDLLLAPGVASESTTQLNAAFTIPVGSAESPFASRAIAQVVVPDAIDVFWTGSVSFAETGGQTQAVSGSTIPEPTSLALLGLGGLLVARRRRG